MYAFGNLSIRYIPKMEQDERKRGNRADRVIIRNFHDLNVAFSLLNGCVNVQAIANDSHSFHVSKITPDTTSEKRPYNRTINKSIKFTRI